MVAPFSKFYGKIWVSLCLKIFFLGGFILKPTERAYVILKESTRDFQNSPLLERSTCFYVTIIGTFEHFQYFNFEAGFLESRNGVFPVTTSFCGNFCFSLKTSCKELIWCTNYPNVHVSTFWKRWSFIWRCIFPVSIFNLITYNPACFNRFE